MVVRCKKVSRYFRRLPRRFVLNDTMHSILFSWHYIIYIYDWHTHFHNFNLKLFSPQLNIQYQFYNKADFFLAPFARLFCYHCISCSNQAYLIVNSSIFITIKLCKEQSILSMKRSIWFRTPINVVHTRGCAVLHVQFTRDTRGSAWLAWTFWKELS